MKELEKIRSNFNKLKAELDEKKVDTIGVLELKKYEDRIIQLQEDNTRLKEKTRYDVSVDIEDLGTLFKASEELWADMSDTLEIIDTVLKDKESQIDECDVEIAKHKSIIDMYIRKAAVYTDLIHEDEKALGEEDVDSEFSKLCTAEMEAESKKLDKLNELIQRHREICFGFNETVSTLRNGGVLKKPKTKAKDKDEMAEDAKIDLDTAFNEGVTPKLWDKAFTNGNVYDEAEEKAPEANEVDALFANGMPKDLWDKAFVNGSEDYEEKPALEDGDLAELVLPDLGDVKAKDEKEIIPVTVVEEGEVVLPPAPESEVPAAPEVPVETEEEVEKPVDNPAPAEEKVVLPPAPEAEVPAAPEVPEAPAAPVEEAPAVEAEAVLPPTIGATDDVPSPVEEAEVILPPAPETEVAPMETPAEEPDLTNQSLENAMSNFDWDKYFEKTFDDNGQMLTK